jgi:enolase-phosphatase E1
MISAILLDIEGTTTPIDFVHKTLFPFAKNNINDFVRENFDEIQDEIGQLKVEYKKDFLDQIYGRDFDENSPETITNYLKFLIEVDRKSPPLKSLQGKIWKQGYESGVLKSEIYEDAFRAFKRWKSESKIITVYSSGSILAQKLLFKYTIYGDLTSFISDYFDTNIGAKREVESYRQIACGKSFPQVENFLFISDVAQELDAAKKAGFQTLLSVREGNAPIDMATNNHQIINSFDEIV